MEKNEEVSRVSFSSSKKRKTPDGTQTEQRGGKKSKRQEGDEGVLSVESLEETTHVIRDGLRCVIPYQYTFKVFAKERWLGKKLIEVLLQEFRANDENYYRQAIDFGLIYVESKTKNEGSPDYLLQHSDRIVHQMHRHEPPVTSRPIVIVHQDEEILVIDKPSSIPVSPQHGDIYPVEGFWLSPVTSIDRPTSGLLLMAKTKAMAHKISNAIQNEAVVRKTYLAKVWGRAPDGEIDINQPIEVSIKGRGVHKVGPDGKLSRTKVRRVYYDSQSNTSLVLCRLFTGRTHQIRIHLHWLGYPIIQDPLYNNTGGDKLQSYFDTINLIRFAKNNDAEEKEQEDTEYPNETEEQKAKREKSGKLRALCQDCKVNFKDPNPDDEMIFLHAFSYKKLDEWSYKTQLPWWAAEPEDKSGLEIDIPLKSLLEEDLDQYFTP